MKKTITILLLLAVSAKAFSWKETKTHPAITENAKTLLIAKYSGYDEIKTNMIKGSAPLR